MNLRRLALPVTISIVMIVFLNLTFKHWSPNNSNTIVTQENSWPAGRIFRTTISQEGQHLNKYYIQNSNKGHNHHLSQIPEKSVFRAATCQEDLQHIYEIENTNVKARSSSQLTEILYKSVTRPVQGKNQGKCDAVKKDIRFKFILDISFILLAFSLNPVT